VSGPCPSVWTPNEVAGLIILFFVLCWFFGVFELLEQRGR
jgi:hypothetical protein